MVGAGILGRQQDENEVDGLAVHRVEINRLGEPGEQPVDAGDGRQLAMRDGDALADAGGTQLFALQQGLEDHPVVDRHLGGERLGQLLQQLLLVRRLEAGQNGLLVDQGIEGHSGQVPVDVARQAVGLGSTQPMLPSGRL